MAAEAQTDARPHWDEAWFFLGLLSLTSFHGVSMLLGWQGLMGEISEFCGGGNWSIVGFSVAMAATMIIPVIAYAGCVWLIKLLGRFDGKGFRHIFADLSFSLLPMAFAYHIAHNLNHFVRESDGLGNVILNPFGAGAEPLSLLEQKMRHMEMLLPEHMLFALQSGIMVWGVWMAVRVLGYRANDLFGPGTKSRGLALAPMVLLILGVTGFNTYLLMQDMIMRM